MRISDWSSDVCSSDLTAPSPLSDSILTAKPYAFLDDAPAEERRTLTVRTGGFAEDASARDLGELDSAAIARVREEMRPEPMNEDEQTGRGAGEERGGQDVWRSGGAVTLKKKRIKTN